MASAIEWMTQRLRIGCNASGLQRRRTHFEKKKKVGSHEEAAFQSVARNSLDVYFDVLGPTLDVHWMYFANIRTLQYPNNSRPTSVSSGRFSGAVVSSQNQLLTRLMDVLHRAVQHPQHAFAFVAFQRDSWVILARVSTPSFPGNETCSSFLLAFK